MVKNPDGAMRGITCVVASTDTDAAKGAQTPQVGELFCVSFQIRNRTYNGVIMSCCATFGSNRYLKMTRFYLIATSSKLDGPYSMVFMLSMIAGALIVKPESLLKLSPLLFDPPESEEAIERFNRRVWRIGFAVAGVAVVVFIAALYNSLKSLHV